MGNASLQRRACKSMHDRANTDRSTSLTYCLAVQAQGRRITTTTYMLLLLLLMTRETPYGGSQNALAPESSLASGLLATSLLYAALFCTSPTE